MPDKINPVSQALTVKVCESVGEAAARGYVCREPAFKPVQLEHVVLVRNGTLEGKATVDFVMKDAQGQRYVFMMTRALLDTIPR